MKTIFLFLLLVAPIFGNPPPQAIVLWGYEAEEGEDTALIAGYRVHYGTQSGNYTDVIDVGLQNHAVIKPLELGVVYYSVVTAYTEHLGSDGAIFLYESDFSNEISFTPNNEAWKPIFEDFLIDFNQLRISFNVVLHPVYDRDYFTGESVNVMTSNDLLNWFLVETIMYSGQRQSIFDQDIEYSPKKFYKLEYLEE